MDLDVKTASRPTIDDEKDTAETMKVEKRDGRIVDFDLDNVITAISAAYKDISKTIGPEENQTITEVANAVSSKVSSRYQHLVKIDEIQNLVVRTLQQDFHLYDVARSYNEYKFNKDEKRAKESDVNYAVERLMKRDKSLVNENANKDSNVYSTQRDLLACSVSKAIARKMLPADVVRAHERGQIHYHDMDYSPFTAETNCSLPNFKDMLANGFELGNAEMESPKSIETAATQLVQIISDVAASQYGGQTVNRIDELLSVYAMMNYQKNADRVRDMIPDELDLDMAKLIVSKNKAKENHGLHCEERPAIIDHPLNGLSEDTIEGQRDLLTQILTRKNIYDAMQTFEYATNSNRSTQGQTPFVTAGFGLGTDWASREITRAMFLVRIRGLGKDHRTAIFPKLTYTIKYGLNSAPGDANYDLKQLALECSTKRMYPDILFYENIKSVTGSFKAPMGCRSFLQGWINPETGKDEEEGRMNLGVVTVNLPYIALESKGDVKKFWKLFAQRMEVAHHALQARIKRSKEAQPINAPVLYKFGAFGRLKDGDSVDKLFKNSRSTCSLGYIGVYEAVSVFYGKDWVNNSGWDEDAREFGVSILRTMTDLCHQWEDEEGYHYSVYGTPAESLTDRFHKALLQKFGVVPGVTDHDFVTNSFHRPVWLSGDGSYKPGKDEEDVRLREHFQSAMNGGSFSKLDFEHVFLPYTAGGHIVYTEQPMLQQNMQALESVWDYAHTVGVDYLGTNTPIDECLLCGYQGDFQPTDEGYECPECGNHDPSTTSVTKRTCGYLGNPVARPMIKGRHEELAHRVKNANGITGKITLPDGDASEDYEDRALPIHKEA
jgi:ribonucleoside-triphosphate reductase